MAKTYTQQLPVSRDFVIAEDYNAEARGVLAEFNGQLDAQQLPMSTWVEDRFTQGDNLDAVIKTTPAGASAGTGQRLPSQTYARTTTAIVAFAQDVGASGGSDILGPPSKVYATNSSDWQPGWNALSKFVADGVYLKVSCFEGTIKGCAITDIAYYFGEKSNMGGTGNNGTDQRVDLGVFVDNVLVARTGYQPSKRHTYCLPFAIPVPTRPVTVDLRFRALYSGIVGNNPYYYVSDTNVSIYNSTLWVRNQYR